MKIMVVEDEAPIRQLIRKSFELKEYRVIDVESAEEGLVELKKQDFDIVILDIMLPGMSGFEFCQMVREYSQSIGIILLTAKSQDHDKLKGLGSGADDYVVKPFSPLELIARAESLYRKVQLIKQNDDQRDNNILESRPFRLNKKERTLYKNDNEIKITVTEYHILELFLSNKSKILSRDDILDAIWGPNYVGSLKTVDVNIQRLRRKIGDDYIETVWGRGYKWTEKEQ